MLDTVYNNFSRSLKQGSLNKLCLFDLICTDFQFLFGSLVRANAEEEDVKKKTATATTANTTTKTATTAKATTTTETTR